MYISWVVEFIRGKKKDKWLAPYLIHTYKGQVVAKLKFKIKGFSVIWKGLSNFTILKLSWSGMSQGENNLQPDLHSNKGTLGTPYRGSTDRAAIRPLTHLLNS
jgi:hypothetical protein